MPEPLTRSAHSARLAPWIVLAMLAMIAVPATITLNTVRTPATFAIASNPTPYGYTWSLLSFVVPIVVIGWWFIPGEHIRIPKRAFWYTMAILVPGGCALDFFFASHFFVFPNPGAVLPIHAPALGQTVPLEEYVFYLTGFMTVLLLYIWMDEYWLALYNVPDYHGESRKIDRLLRFHPTSLITGVVLIVGAIVYKKFFSPESERAGFPGYFTLLVAAGFVPSAGFYPAVRRFINWRAFSLTTFFILLVSLLWEATLAIPYSWWGYQSRQMMGLHIGAWSGLPIEAVSVWIAVTCGTVIVFEVVKLWQASERAIVISKGYFERRRTLPDRISAAPITSAQRARPGFWGLTGLCRARRARRARRAVYSIPPWSTCRQFRPSVQPVSALATRLRGRRSSGPEFGRLGDRRGEAAWSRGRAGRP